MHIKKYNKVQEENNQLLRVCFGQHCFFCIAVWSKHTYSSLLQLLVGK